MIGTEATVVPSDVPLVRQSSEDSSPVKAALSMPREHVDDSQVATVRNMLPSECLAVSDADIQRFIRATGGNLAQSAKRLQTTLTWRKQNRPEEKVCTACARDPRSHYMHVVGYDSLQRPIIYSCLEAATNKVFQDNHDHMIQTFETAIKCMPPGVEQWVWVCDFHGFGMADANPKLAKAFLSISAEHYPERLGLFLVVDAPSLFGLLWKGIQHFVDPKTYAKIRFLPNDLSSAKSTLRACLKQTCDDTTTNWLVKEMLENRQKDKVRKKSYSMSQIHSSASDGKLLPLPEHDHDVRGCPALLEQYASAPDVLEPQALLKL